MKKFTFLLCLLLIPSLVYAQEKVTGFEDKDLPVLNEELRKTSESIEEIETTLAELETIPTGVIVMWSGAISAIPEGWAICDGNNGTPDLTDRFVLHADADTGGTNDVGDTGGASTHAHGVGTYANSTDGDHTHGRGAMGAGLYAGAAGGYVIANNGDHTHTISGDSESVSNVPKYYALAFIMKL